MQVTFLNRFKPFNYVVLILCLLLGTFCFAKAKLSKAYTYEQLQEASIFLRLSFDEKKRFCKKNFSTAPKLMQSLKSVIDEKVTEEFGDNRFDIEKFRVFLQKANEKCSCTCGIYTYIYEQLAVELEGKTDSVERIYQSLSKKTKGNSSSQEKSCSQKTAKWFCQSSLYKFSLQPDK